MAASPFDLTGKVALVTGGNGGIGLGMARGMAKAGATIVIAARNRQKSAAAVAELSALGAKVEALEVDVADPDACRAMVETANDRFGRLDILVNNAGIARGGLPQSISLADWSAVLQINLTAAMIAAQAAHPIMKAQGGGKIINIGSMYAIFGGPFQPAYAAAKGGAGAAHQVAGRRLGASQHPGQRHPAGLDNHRDDRRRQGLAELQRQHRRPHAGRPLGRAGGLRRPRGVPRQRRLRLRDRGSAQRRRRLRDLGVAGLSLQGEV